MEKLGNSLTNSDGEMNRNKFERDIKTMIMQS